MPHRTCLPTAALRGCLPIALVFCAHTAGAVPRGGLWELTSTLAGPTGSRAPETIRTCIGAEALERAPERALLDAAIAGNGIERGPAKCELSALRRDAERSSWTARCQGPIGPMWGWGRGVLRDVEATLRHTFNVSGWAGSIELHQSIEARRIGEC